MNWRPSADWETLRLRADLVRDVREFFRVRGFLEVETPTLLRDVVVDAHIEPLAIAGSEPLFLQTSPEFAHKRLLAAGSGPIFEITRAYRAEESGKLHNREFTMLEWYQPGADHHAGMNLVEELVRSVFQGTRLRVGLSNDPFPRLAYFDAFEQALGTCVREASPDTLRQISREKKLQPPAISLDDRDGWLNFLLMKVVEPWLAAQGAVFVFDYPATQAALARTRGEVAERFELYLAGVEICNGYHELTDAEELRTRQKEQNRLRLAANREALPEENLLLAAMDAGMPESCGVALGVDRLMMLALGKQSLAEVMAFPEFTGTAGRTDASAHDA